MELASPVPRSLQARISAPELVVRLVLVAILSPVVLLVLAIGLVGISVGEVLKLAGQLDRPA